MRRFALAASIVYGVITVVALTLSTRELSASPALWLSVVLSSWLAPTLATWLAAEGVNLLSPRRILNRRLPMPIKRLALGAAAGLIGGILAVLGMAAIDRTSVPDAAITAIAAATATLVALLPTARIRPGVCLFCNYSHAGATPTARGVCTECGADLHAA